MSTPGIDVVSRSNSIPFMFYVLFNLQGSMLNKALPDNVHLLTLELWNETTALIRLEHQFEKMEDQDLSKNVTVNLKVGVVKF